MSLHRFHLPSVAGRGAMELPEAAHAHVTRVLRLVEGDALRVFDAGREFDAIISAVEKRRVLIEVGAAVTPLPERAIELHLIMSPLKGDLTELVIQKATELGVARISPVVFERTDTVARRDPSDNRMERWHRVAISAAEQSGRAMVPQLDHVTPLKSAMDALGSIGPTERRVVATEPSLMAADTEGPAGGATGGRADGSLVAGAVRIVTVAVGPAGGFAASDLTALGDAGFIPERLAPHTLRAETACIAAIAILGDRYR